MCPLPDEAVPASVAVHTDNWLRQLEYALPQGTHADILTLFHNGNFFSDREVPPQRREAVYAWLRGTPVTTLVVESLPQFVTDARLADARRMLRADQRIDVAIGLQSTDSFLRETVLASTCSEQGFMTAVAALAAHGYGRQVFLMHQMPFLTAQESSVALAQSVKVLMDRYAIADPILCPLRIAPATVAHELHGQGRLPLPSLWHLVDVLVHLRTHVSGSRARVAASLLQPSTPQAPHTDACPLCRDGLVDWIADFNRQQDGNCPKRCSCAPAPVDFGQAYDPAVVARRVQEYLSSTRLQGTPLVAGKATGCGASAC
jgi:radical SAM enzyme (TIGR01210 family)